MKALKFLREQDIVFIDIETVRLEDKLKKGSDLQHAWAYKTRYDSENKSIGLTEDQLFKEKASLYAEFGKIVCITVGRITKDTEGNSLPVFKNYASSNEKELLTSFMNDLNKVCSKNSSTFLFGHAIKGFDMPFIFRRCLINGVEPNYLIDIGEAKPWELTTKDTLELWKSGAFYSASLLAIATAFGLPSPKASIEGSEVSEVYWKDEKEGLNRIVRYCMRDVLTLINIFRKCRFEEPFIIKDIYDEPEVKPVLKKPAQKRKIAPKTTPKLKVAPIKTITNKVKETV